MGLKSQKDCCHVIVGIDEVHDLGNIETRILLSRSFRYIERLYQNLKLKNRWKTGWHVVFPVLSTNSNLPELTERSEDDASMRVLTPLEHPRPFIAFPSDVLRPKHEGKALRVPLEEMPLYRNLRLLGRPLYSFDYTSLTVHAHCVS